jgi:hypothetical protein
MIPITHAYENTHAQYNKQVNKSYCILQIYMFHCSYKNWYENVSENRHLEDENGDAKVVLE